MKQVIYNYSDQYGIGAATRYIASVLSDVTFFCLVAFIFLFCGQCSGCVEVL
jgi:hypothetical protein